MDTATYINKLRAQFLWECPEKDQMRRIIKPFTPENKELPKADQEEYHELENKVRSIFMSPDGVNLLDQLESPPISENYMENYKSNNRAKLKQGKKNVEEALPIYDINQSEYEREKDKFDNANSLDSTLRNGNTTWKVESKQNLEDVPTLQGVGNSRRVELNGSDLARDSSDSDSDDTKKKTSRRLPFSRIFKGRKDSDDVHKKVANKKKMTFANRNKKHIAFDMNFDYDKNLDEDDEDEDEDDGENLQSEFFQLDSEQSKSDSQNGIGEKDNAFHLATSSNSLVSMHTNGNNNNSNNNNTSINNTHGRKKNHFPQNIIPRNPLLDGTKNNSFKSDRLTKGSNHDDSLSTTSKKKTTSKDDYISDMESLINEDDLDKLDLENISSNVDKSISAKQLESIDISNSEASNSDQIVLNEENDTDSISSYGRSLLDSDLSTETDLNKEDTSVLESSSILNDSDIIAATLSHSIPKTVDEYGIYHGQDDSTINDVFDNAVQNIKNLDKTPPLREKRSSSQLISRSLLNRRPSGNSNVGSKPKMHTRSSSGASTAKVKTDLSKSHHTASDGTHGRPSIKSNRSSSKDSSLIIQKITDFKKPTNTDSLLSSLFNNKKQSPKTFTDALEYFSFVSGSKVPNYDAEDLNVYIQKSKKYEHSSFKLNVRKSASIFEVIGYILYMYSKELKQNDTKDDSLSLEMIQDPNKFCLKIVDEDGEPFEDDFGKLERSKLVKQLSDDEVVLCMVDENEMKKNNKETPLPYNLEGHILSSIQMSKSADDNLSSGINQLSYYKPILGNENDFSRGKSAKELDIKVYMYPSTNKIFNFTSIRVLVTSSVNDILVKYCKMKNLDPNDYLLKIPGKKVAYNLNDTVLRLDGNNEVEIISKIEARKLKVQKSIPDIAKPNLPTIQSNELTPLTLEPLNAYLQPEVNEKVEAIKEAKPQSRLKKLGPKHRLGLTAQTSGNSNTSGGGNTAAGFFKNKNSSKSSLHGSLQYYTPNRSSLNVNGNGTGTYQDLFSGAYHKYKVWRRQQMSLMNKHERALALDGDYIYIVPPEKQLHWHENVKTKSIHISQVVLIKKSRRVPEYFKLFFRRGQHDIKRYYFEAVSANECNEIVSRIQSSVGAYRMNHK